jgi:hypothetical protein
MRLTACALVLAGLVSAANAMPAPTTDLALPEDGRSPTLWSIYLGPAGAMLESDYFNAPRGPFRDGRIVPCRLDTERRDANIRLAYACRNH